MQSVHMMPMGAIWTMPPHCRFGFRYGRFMPMEPSKPAQYHCWKTSFLDSLENDSGDIELVTED